MIGRKSQNMNKFKYVNNKRLLNQKKARSLFLDLDRKGVKPYEAKSSTERNT